MPLRRLHIAPPRLLQICEKVPAMPQPETATIDPAIDPVEPTKKPKPQPKRMTMTNKSVERIPTPAKETIFWDESFRSFGVRVSPKGTKSWTCFVRIKPAMRG